MSGILTPDAIRYTWQHINGDKLSLIFTQTDDDADGPDGTPDPFETGSTCFGTIKSFADDDENLVYLGPAGTVGIDGTIEVIPGSVSPVVPAQIIVLADEGVILDLALPPNFRGFFALKLRPGGREADAYTYAMGPFELILSPGSEI